MLFQFGLRSSLLLPFVVPGAAATLWLLLRAWRRSTPPDALLALLLAVPTLSAAQWMLGYAGWYDSHNGYSTFMFYVPWQLNLLLGPGYYLYFRSLTNQEFRLGPRAWWHLLPGLLKIGLYTVAAAYDLGWWHGLRGQPMPYHFGTKGLLAQWLDGLNWLLSYPIYVLLPLYSWLVLASYRRYTRYLDDNFSDSERLRFAGLRQLLILQVLSWTLSLVFELLDVTLGFGYDEAWNYFALRGLLLYGLIVVGVQANYAAATTPLRFEPAGPAREELGEEPPGLPTPPDVTEAPLVDLGKADTPLAAAAVLPPELEPWRERLLRLMADEQPWLEPELTLTELAQRLRTNPALLSKVINTGCGQNFNDFVNTYRVHEARRKLADPRFAHYSLVGVALESGFNSKSTFNRVFKKLLEQAPSEVARPKS
ncbi:AraC family transcriptional regulator [Hymenobacter sp. BT559]|uniref:helix-turn-helix domain-containing protein n=1 Tax=Hymenobacter sp. BT559 TaxID=2795729 RepID=UPI0018EDC3A2|nr:helix-turn-helix transcriptional regulator [Hymenobacter sp. BT559]MBJ6142067.1 helix-turn-helix transcriptional regulator [Hymenobacter sp. BT559]